MTHVSEEVLECYSMNNLPEDRIVQVQEHLLICEPCREKLTEVDLFVSSMKVAAQQIAEEEQRASSHSAPLVRHPLLRALSRPN
jgi:predicted anti-sigma-YlaC factor YlaD